MRTVLLYLVIITSLNVASSRPLNSNTTKPSLLTSHGLNNNYTRQTGGRLRLACDFELKPLVTYNPSDLTIYWVKNYQELLQPKKAHIHIVRKKLSTVLILRNLESFDSGSYMCIAELSLNSGSILLNASSETTVFVKEPDFERQENLASLDINDYLLDFGDDLTDEFPQLNPTIVENFDDKGFCESYKGSICSGIITGDMTIYSTSSQQQELIEERLRSIIPLLSDSNKNNLSKQCSTFAIPSLCLFAFPLCDQKKKQPKQICRSDCRQLQDDICKNEYFNVKSLFTSGSSSQNVQANSNFLLDCNQLPPSSDSPKDCLPMISMILSSLDPIATKKTASRPPVEIVSIFNDKVKCMSTSNGIDYYGTQSVTRNGFQCQRWDSQTPHQHPYSHIPGLAGHNYCRNLDSSGEPWCYTTNPSHPRDYCNIPKCNIIDTTLKNLPNLVAIAVPVGLVLILIIIIICVYCRCCRNKENLEDKSLKTSMNSNVMSAVATMGPDGNVNTHIQPNRLRMSNASLGKVKKTNHYKAASSKSSVASSQQAKQNMEQLHPFIKNNYENDAQFQNQQIIQQQQQHQQMMPFQQPHQQIDYTVKHFTPQNIRLLQEIGKGRFGSVYTGELIGSFGSGSNNVVKATVKTLRPTKASFDDCPNNIPTSTPVVNNKYQADTDAAAHFNEQEFYNEISLYSSIRNRHLANLIGIYTTNYQRSDTGENCEDTDMPLNHPQCMIFEHLNNGDLHEYLLQRATSVNSAAIYNGMMGSQSNLSAVSSSIGGVSSNYLNLQQQQRNVADFLYIGQQIASGMEYLSSQNFILKDLATRNILMSDNLTVKISIDLIAQYKDTYAKDYYKFQMKMLPVRWMPPESLLYGRYNQQSDVWSFGVVLYELFSYGCQPYVGSTNPEAIEMIRDRQLLSIPDECPQRVYALMLECWHELPMQRPTFTEILNRLRNWENYYLFNNAEQQQMPLMPPPPLPLPIHLQQQQQVPQFGMTQSYSSNSQTSKASSLLGNTASTGLSSSGSPPPLPAPLHMSQHLNQQQSQCYSPSKMQTNLFMSKFNANCNTNSLRMSQRNFQFNLNSNGPVSGGLMGNNQDDLNYEL